ncbi:VHS domain-containing protein [Acorus calamus]|uniref:VHS domain-containing protein n=1 Tax=Acorus calamus TaxID=4465 RepID=A0AAV9ELL4_ACOCL|nr:VHS domain-containing protein [Acorus calamus]
MDSSRRAVEAYWRSKMVDGVTTDVDKVAPVYKLEELCDLLRSSPAGIVKEVSDYVLKRLDNKSPIVKQKALRLIKYAVGKSGVEFKREMQRHSAVMRQLVHYKGHPDPLKGDALNKAVRDTAQEAIVAVFAIEDNKPAPTEGLNKRIQGFGNTNYEPPLEDKKSFLSEVVGIGSASIKQGLSSIAAAHSMRMTDDNGSYRSPNLRRSLTTETSRRDEHYGGSLGSSSATTNEASGPLGLTVSTNGGSSSSHTGSKTREERLLETIVTSGGVRLQPTRDAIQVFLVEAAKLDVMAMTHAIESKLQSHMWQVLTLMDGGQTGGVKSIAGQPSSSKANTAPTVELPDLIDAGTLDDSSEKPNDESISCLTSANVSFHTDTADKGNTDDIFSGLTVDDKLASNGSSAPTSSFGSDFLDVFSSNSQQLPQKDVHDLMGGLTVNDMPHEDKKSGAFFDAGLFNTSSEANVSVNHNAFFQVAPMQYSMPQNFMLNPAFASQPVNYAAMGNYIAQQQQMLSTFHNLGNFNTGVGQGVNNAMNGQFSPIPDILNVPNYSTPSPLTTSTSLKKEDTKAFDFISDHLSAARDPKRVS